MGERVIERKVVEITLSIPQKLILSTFIIGYHAVNLILLITPALIIIPITILIMFPA